jgi:hypothetical protein
MQQQASAPKTDIDDTADEHHSDNEDGKDDLPDGHQEERVSATGAEVSQPANPPPSSTAAVHLPSFALFNSPGSAQKSLLLAIQIATALSTLLNVVDDRAATKLPASQSSSTVPPSMDVTPAQTSVNGQDGQEKSGDDSRPVVVLDLQELWADLHECLLELSTLGRNSTFVTVLKEAIESFFYSHRSVKPGPKIRSSLAHQVSITHPQTPTDALSLEELDAEAAVPLRMSLFVSFIEAHKKLLNDLIRKTPNALLSDPFSVLVQFPQILDFRVKEDYFRHALKKQYQQRYRTSLHINRSVWLLRKYHRHTVADKTFSSRRSSSSKASIASNCWASLTCTLREKRALMLEA